MICSKYYFIQQQIFCFVFFSKADNTIYFNNLEKNLFLEGVKEPLIFHFKFKN